MKRLLSYLTALTLVLSCVSFPTLASNVEIDASDSANNTSTSTGGYLYIDEDGDPIYSEDEPTDSDDISENTEDASDTAAATILEAPIVTTTSSASSQTDEFSFNEFDEVLLARESSLQELASMGISPQTAKEIANTDIEGLVSSRAKWSTSKLEAYGYTDDEIDVLKSYDGSPITSSSAVVQSAAAKCTAKAFAIESGKTKVKFRYRFKWSHLPMLSDSDKIAVRWCAYDSHPYDFAVDATHYARVKYYYGDKARFMDRLTTRFKADESGCSDGCSRKFSLKKKDSASKLNCWAKRSWITVTLKATGTSKINYVKFSGAYGHTYVTPNPSIGISFPVPSISISFSPTSKVKTLAGKQYKLKANGTFRYLGRTDA